MKASSNRRWLLSGAWAVLLPACTLLVDPEVGAGLGTACAFDDQCQGSTCIEGICAVACGDSNGCPGGTECAQLLSGNGGSCQLTLRAGFVYGGDPAQFDFIRAFDDGRVETEAVPALGYLETSVSDPAPLASDAADAARALAALGNRVVVSTMPSHAQAFADIAAEVDDTLMLAFQSPTSGGNLVSYDARMYQAYYLAGIAAVRMSTSKRLGFVAGAVTPRVIASVNAFALGAQSELPTAIVEARFLGEPHDTQPKVDGKSRERRFVEELVTSGSDVIAHNLDNNIPLFTVRDLLVGDGPSGEPEPDIFAVAANIADGCAEFESLPDGASAEEQSAVNGRCIAAAFYHWAPLFTRVFDDFHRDKEIPPTIYEPILASNSESVVGFSVDPAVGAATVMKVDDKRAKLAANVESVFTGPIESTSVDCDPLPCVAVAEGATLDDAAINSMCWLARGIVGADNLPLVLPAEGDCVVE